MVLALLQPDGDAAGDLGATILAAHRAGAGACEAVAKAGLVSPAALINALATTRVLMADAMVTSVAKSMDSRYAGLLIADLFDDAEKAALSLYSTMISKGVSPPTAAGRVGSVFGVPSHAMGKYQQLACDPKANPVALVDAADRSLMSYVAKMVAAEAKEEVSKVAPTTFKDDDFDPRRHPRGMDGQFILGAAKPSILQPHILAQIRSIGGGGQGAPQVGPRERPQTRQLRRTRKYRQVAPAAKPQMAPVGQMQGKPLSARQMVSLQVAAQMNPRQLLTPVAPRKLPYLLTLPDPKNKDALANADVYEIGSPLVFGSDTFADNDFHIDLALQAHEQADPATAVFRMGWLLEKAGYPQIEMAKHAITRTDEKTVDSPATQQITALADDAKAVAKASGYVEPETRFIHIKDMLPGVTRPTKTQVKDWKESERLSEFSWEETTKDGRVKRHKDTAEEDFVKVMPQYLPLGPDINPQDYDADVVVHYKPEDPTKPSHRPQPAVVEYVLGDSAIGTEEGEGGYGSVHRSFTLDKNTAYKIVVPPNMPIKTKPGPLTMWDDQRKVVVHRYYLRAVDEVEVNDILGPEKMSKAATTFMERAHPRDAFGQWINAQMTAVRTPEQAPQANPRQTRNLRTTRKTRKYRQVAPAAEQASPSPGQMAGRLTGGALSPVASVVSSLKASFAMQSVRNKTAAGMPVLPPLSESSDYRLLTAEDYTAIDQLIGKEDQHTLYGGGEVQLSPLAVKLLKDHHNFHVDELSAAMRYSVEAELDSHQDHLADRAPISAMPHGMRGETNMVSGSFDHEAVTRRVASLFEADDKLAQIEIEVRGNSFYFYGNPTPASPMVLFQIDPDLNDKEPVVMTWKGEHRAHDVRAQNGDKETSLVDVGFSRYEEAETQNVSDPVLHIFKITNPVAHRLVVHNA